VDPVNASRQGLITSFLSRLATPRLFVLVAALFVFDLLVPDLIPFLDEIVLAGLTLALSRWKAPVDTSATASAAGATGPAAGRPRPDLPDIEVRAR
jgi:hypothetical protein